jgi:hypothetical protein
MTLRSRWNALVLGILLFVAVPARAEWTLIGWNNLGMHCMDADYSVFSILPPYNTIHAQLVDTRTGLVTAPAGITVTYEAVAAPNGLVNTTSAGKTNFWDHVADLFGAAPGIDEGLAGADMPGAGNTPQPMAFDSANDWFIADGIPITPYADGGAKNYYPMMRLVARDGSGRVLATTDIVLPVSDEMTCVACHASGSDAAGQPAEGWVNDPDPERDYRLNILRLHDDFESGRPAFSDALAAKGYNSSGLFATATEDGKPILCASCHASEALPGSGIEGIPPLTQAIHRSMAHVIDPTNGLPLDSVENRSACYRCHPGSATRCLRGAMGAAVADNGSLAMQCQSCHGTMLDVAARDRSGWLDEPNCQSCHTGTATQNAGQIRYTSVFATDGSVRLPADPRFATNPDTPANGISLYRFSSGHGGLQCSACHGSTHAIFPSAHESDNLQSEQIQGHVGVLADCESCHATTPRTVDGGPHGLHPVGQDWVGRHGDVAEDNGTSACRECHGTDYRGTVLSRSLGDRTLTTEYGPRNFWRGFQIGCYNCHRGPNNDDANPNRAPSVGDAALQTSAGITGSVALQTSDADGNQLSLRVVNQPKHGTAAIADTTARYFPEPGFVGEDGFDVAANDGQTDSALARVSVTIAGTSCTGDCDADAAVTVDEIVRGVSIALGTLPATECTAFDASGDGQVTVDEIVSAVTAALQGCSA